MLTRRAFLRRLATITAGAAGAVALSRLPVPEDAQHAAFLRGEGPRHFAGATPGVPQRFLVLPRGYNARFLTDGGVIITAEMPMPDFKVHLIDVTSADSHPRARQYMPVLPQPEYSRVWPAGELLPWLDGSEPPNYTALRKAPTPERVRVAAWDAAMLPEYGKGRRNA